MDQYRYFVTTGGQEMQILPTNNRSLKEVFNLEDADRRFSFNASFDGLWWFDGDDYKLFKAIEDSGDKCRSIPLRIERFCGSAYHFWRAGVINLIDGEWDLDDCILKIKPKLKNAYSCYEDNASKEVNFLNLPIDKTVGYHLRGEIKYFAYTVPAYKIDDPAQFGGSDPDALGWAAVEAAGSVIYDGVARPRGSRVPTTYSFTFTYAREEFSYPTQPSPEWVSIGPNLWARKPLLVNYTKLYLNNVDPAVTGQAPIRFFGGDLFSYDIIGVEVAGRFDNGLLLNDVIKYFVTSYCGLRVKSDFLQLNPEATFAATYPLFPDGETYHHLLYQKSDIKRPLVSNNATKALWDFKKLLTNICNIYNLQWTILGDQFIIEHVSFFNRDITLDITSGKHKQRVIRTKKYKYKTERIPKYEYFKFMEAGATDFVGLPVEYVGDCVNLTAGNRDRTTVVDNLTTDLEFTLANSDPDSSKVSDYGFFLLAVKKDAIDGRFYTFAVPPVLEATTHVNNSLGWAYLHDKYHKHRRLQLNGYMNGKYTMFVSAKPVKQRTRVEIDFCCTDTINLTGKVVTDLGTGEIDAATFVAYENILELDIVYPDIPAKVCLQPSGFTFVRRDGEYFYFDTTFAVAGVYMTEIEAILPDGSTVVRIIDADLGGVGSVEFGPVQNGNYRFRKRVICDADSKSEFTEYITVSNGAVVVDPVVPDPCELPLPKPSYIGRNKTKFTFRFAGIQIDEDVEFEVTAKNSIVAPYAVFSKTTTLIGATDVVVDVIKAYSEMEQSKISILGLTNGEYKFRFRKNCGGGKVSPYSETITVNI